MYWIQKHLIWAMDIINNIREIKKKEKKSKKKINLDIIHHVKSLIMQHGVLILAFSDCRYGFKAVIH